MTVLEEARRAEQAEGHRGVPYALGLIAILFLFTWIKAPYLAAPFTGEHSMKYNTYVEPAVYMVQKDSMLWNQKKYVSDPVHNPEGIFPKFEHLPLMEWGLFLTYRLFHIVCTNETFELCHIIMNDGIENLLMHTNHF